jgi:hypothetical protein
VLNETKSWDVSSLLSRPLVEVEVEEAAGELQLEASSKSAADAAEGSCSTPNMDWPADAPSVELLQEQAEQQQQQAAVGVSIGTADSSNGSRASQMRKSPVCKAAAAAAAPAGSADVADHAAATSSASLEVSSSSAAAAAAAAGGLLEGCPSWPSPVVSAFAHCKGRLGYVMSSGVVGVVFEDSTHMFVRSSDGWACYLEHGDSSSAAAGVGAEPVVVLGQGVHAATAAAAAAAGDDPGKSASLDVCAQHARRSSDTGRNDPAVLKDQDSALSGSSPAAAAAKADASCSPVAAATIVLTFQLPAVSSPAVKNDGTTADNSSSSNGVAPPAVPEQLASKARCLRRFVGCLLHHKPYSSSCQPDVTRLPFPVARKRCADSPPAAAVGALEQQQQLGSGAMHVGVPHLRSFVHREGCLHLKISDGCHQFVFTGDNSVLLLNAQCSQLAYVTYSRARRASRHQAAGADTAAVAGTASVQVLPLGAAAAAAAAAPPADARLLASAVYASKLVQALQLPASWLEASSSSSAAATAASASAASPDAC